MDILRLSAAILLSAHLCLSLSVEVFEPHKSHGPEAALIIVPGAHIHGTAYKSLADDIQKKSDFRLWIALTDGFINKSPNLLQLSIVFREAIHKLIMAEYKGQRVFLAGHGLGGHETALFGQSSNHLLEGIMLFSAFPAEPLHTYPVPVLSLSGDLDGLTRVTRVMDLFENLQKHDKKHPMQKYKTPVIVMEGVNHALFASGKMPSNVANYDLDPDVSMTAAHDLISNFTNAFMVSVRNDSDTNVDKAMSILEDGYMATSLILQPLSNIKALDQNEEYVSHWTNTAQQLVVSMKNTTSIEFVNYETQSENSDRKYDLSIESSGDDLKIQSHTILSVPQSFDTTSPVSPTQLKATMTSQEAVKKLLPSDIYGTTPSCKEINQEAFILAYAQSSTAAKDRYSSKGRPIKFLGDHNTTSEIKWLMSSLSLHYNTTGLFVRASRLHTDVKSPFPGKAGHYDCTLLSPYRAMEWIYVDSLRYTKPHNNTTV